ncbi:putative transcriptional regulator [Beutenbergia cavernae DSM 12333]|uniref:Putative transcriptional regulator n=1 Tax=Beutenbergia cavernae (strain ATCC BAA-8 / DSM 12333 / CCUG 43141 / JCM 11478 / NBRC 16432 / NCIMB 13614 / HKI 0122) TaxID=471853 RepID=C5BXA9_BEUC1|nr:winged helix-turn-helix domain-containing protein [Beutenbergia cavernae]ACQ78784.1 putative transcriptional regulator [Beutenbergia cavernae DSM 12333]
MPFEHEPTSTSSLASLRALSHPLRLRIVELLDDVGPLTATEVAAQLADTPSNCSFHLRVLAREGLVEEAPGGRGRARPWRLVRRDVDVRTDDLDDDGRAQLRAVVVALAERFRTHALAWLDRRGEFSPAWREAATSRHLLLRLAPEELQDINERVTELLAPYVERDDDAVPADARSVALTIATLPVLPPRA